MPAFVVHGKEFGFYSKGNGSHQRFEMDKAISPIYMLMSRGLAAVGRLDEERQARNPKKRLR